MSSRTARSSVAGNRSKKGGSRPGKPRPAAASADTTNPRQACPCGSGRRFKHCHGSGAAIRVARPFEGLAGEADWVALRELVSAATAPLSLRDKKYADRTITLATILPQLAPALVRDTGEILLGLQLAAASEDVSRDLGTALQAALEAEPGAPVNPGPIGAAGSAGPRLQDLLSDAPLEITVHDDYGYWFTEAPEGEALRGMLDQANETVIPSYRLPDLEASYWCRPDDTRAHVRWVMTHEERPLLDAMATLGAAEKLDLGPDTRYAGAFRAHGLVAPVWDVPPDAPAASWAEPAKEFGDRLDAELADPTPLDDEARRVRSKLLAGQVTLR